LGIRFTKQGVGGIGRVFKTRVPWIKEVKWLSKQEGWTFWTELWLKKDIRI